MEHTMMKMLLITSLSEMISKKYKISIKDARRKIFCSGVAALIEKEENSLYGDSPLYLFNKFENRIMNS